MRDYSTLYNLVVDRAGFDLPNQNNILDLANGGLDLTDCCGIPLVLANRFGPVRDGNLITSPDHKREDTRNG